MSGTSTAQKCKDCVAARRDGVIQYRYEARWMLESSALPTDILLALAMSTHVRLGVKSLLRLMDSEILSIIIGATEDRKYHTTKMSMSIPKCLPCLKKRETRKLYSRTNHSPDGIRKDNFVFVDVCKLDHQYRQGFP